MDRGAANALSCILRGSVRAVSNGSLSGLVSQGPTISCHNQHSVVCRWISTSQERDTRLLSPTARNLVHHYGLRVDDMVATGPKDTLLKQDVLKYIKDHNVQPGSSTKSSSAPKTAPEVATGARISRRKGPRYVDFELTNMRKVIAKRLTQSKTTIPHAYMAVECDMNRISQLRKDLLLQKIKVSVNDFIIRAAAVSLESCPQVNVKWNDGVERVPTIDISIAVATPSGLITPIIHQANRMSVQRINAEVKQLSEKARLGKLQPHEFQGGSFSISNLGMFGISKFSAVINPPQAAILAVGTATTRLTEKGNKQVMTATLSYDSRAIDEETVAQFLETLSGYLADPESMDRSADRRLSSLISSSS